MAPFLLGFSGYHGDRDCDSVFGLLVRFDMTADPDEVRDAQAAIMEDIFDARATASRVSGLPRRAP
jgi:hypothetical protein